MLGTQFDFKLETTLADILQAHHLEIVYHVAYRNFNEVFNTQKLR